MMAGCLSDGVFVCQVGAEENSATGRSVLL